MRSHRIGAYSFSNTTTIYLKTTYDEKELLSLPAQMNELGLFGWFYNDILKILDIKPKDKTKMIASLQKELSPQKMDSLANLLMNEQKKRYETNVIILLSHGANVHSLKGYALYSLWLDCNVSILDILINAGLDVNQHIANFDNETLLSLATRQEQEKVVQRLLAAGAKR